MSELTREQKRIRIAEACGWIEEIFSDPGERRAWTKSGALTPEGFGQHWACELPDYFGSLDAMHDAENALSDVQHNAYRGILGSMIRTEEGLKDASILSRKFASATATQRAEAFGRTLNLW